MNLFEKYSKTFELLYRYDENNLLNTASTVTKESISYKEALIIIKDLKEFLISKNQASNLFGLEKDDAFKGILENIFQTFNNQELIKTLEEKAVNLLYYIVKDHPFIDGNKRIASLIFVYFLDKNKFDISKITTELLTTITLLIVNSNKEEKDLMIKLICNLIN